VLDCLTVFAALDVVFVGIFCPPDELRRRELARGDRVPGQAVAQLATAHAYPVYDIECDPSTATPLECALQIKQYLAAPEPQSAFDGIRRALIERPH
jgi:chloramphenicol 3-O phosphotransferase